MLVARRDPPFHAGASDDVPGRLGAYPHPQLHQPPPTLSRFVTFMQLVGSLLAVPIGLASAYSIYHSNFSVDASCQNLRSGIVSMLDKSVDAATRRMLVRHDVEAFEQKCGAVDPDATAAFKTLLATEQTRPLKAATPVAVKAPHEDQPAKDVAHKATPHAQDVAKREPPVNGASEAPPARREVVSDTQWLDAVRQAMAKHDPEQSAPEAGAAAAKPAPVQDTAAVASPPPRLIAVPAFNPPVVAHAPAVKPIAPPPQMVARPDAGHPVPPAAIPDPADTAAAKPDQPHSALGRWIARVPLLGPVLQSGQN